MATTLGGATTLTAARVPPRSGTARQLVVLLHGYGADGNDLAEIGRAWARFLPDAAFTAPHAPQRCGAGAGFQWFPLTTRSEEERTRGADAARPGLDAFLDAELTRHGLEPNRLALVGFSQGTMMALHAGLRRRPAPAAILGYSGLLVAGERLKAEAAGKPPILLVHGDRDEVIPFDALFDACDALAAAEVPVQWHASPGVAHSIGQDGLLHGAMFLASSFGVKLPGR